MVCCLLLRNQRGLLQISEISHLISEEDFKLLFCTTYILLLVTSCCAQDFVWDLEELAVLTFPP
jgi:hypothetical protein